MNPVVCTSYFTLKPHPNDPKDAAVVGRGEDGFVLKDSILYIAPWYDSMCDLGLDGRVFYDGLSDRFVERYTTDKIKFVKCTPSDYSNNDWRFHCYLEHFSTYDQEFDSIFLTDGSDVTVVKDPSGILTEFPDTNLFVCQDSIKLAQFPYVKFHEDRKWPGKIKFMLNEKKWDLINMGVVGGARDNVLEFLQEFWDTRTSMGSPEFNADMWVGQYVFRFLLSSRKILIGDPFTSIFKGYEENREDVYFIHK
jgi:hypothetical protein